MQPQQSASQIAALGPKKSHSTLITVVLALLLVAALGFGYWAFSGRQDYKNNVDVKVAAAVVSAQKAQQATDQAKADQAAKQPYNTYQGPDTYGTITFSYPKTWNAYIQSSSSEPINSYYYPSAVPDTTTTSAYALRMELVSDDYNSVLSSLTGSSSTNSTLTAAAYIPPKLKGVKNALPGTMLTGAIWQDNNGNPITGQMLVIPVRDKTLKIYTQSQNFTSDFNNIVLPSLTFTP